MSLLLGSRPGATLCAGRRTPASSRQHAVHFLPRPFVSTSTASSRARAFTCHALATDEDVAEAAPELTLSRPTQRMQPSLDNKQTAEVKSRANGLAATRKLVRVNMGKKGITDNFVIDCMRALRGHEVIRVSVTEGADMHMEEAAETLTGLLDCVCVYKIGSSLTLYRSRDLTMPSNITDTAAERAGQKLQKKAGSKAPQRRRR